MGRRTAVFATALLTGLLAGGCGGGPAATPQAHPSVASPAPTAPTGSAAPGSPAPTASGTSRPAPAGQLQLPRGGRTIFPHYRLVGFAGRPGSTALGRLGVGRLDDRAREIEQVARPYAGGRTVLPVLELIATVVQGNPGPDRMYRTRSSDALIARHLAAARKVKGILLLNIQPGRSDFLTEVKAYATWLEQPDVGVALDPEWSMGPGEVPMKVFGHTTGAQIDAVARYLSTVVKRGDLPEKVLVFHQLAPSVVRGENAIRSHPGVVVVKSVDGIGNRAMKQETYVKLTRRLPSAVHAGFKLFYDEDSRVGRLMTPAQVLGLRPQPEYVLYE
ncbi:hypothetical protein N864_01425 [Intrasporangium chromatireducens Q5-1]|uniref:Lipoprotein n=1 Tax=Intrasporangium chromatireducens Q5-1 TaxID=584657 RepID=W9GI20_9MICO|nr:hypothetical protein [Intrasporangium chromatireducens]EWT05886.1 hypothetical protein N864_01425 [Intrasporangium chromatireducens Q5-1]